MWFVGIEATNSGRLGTEIKEFGFQLPNGRHIQNIYDFLGQPVGKTGISGSYRRTSAPTSGTAPEGKGSNDGR